MPRSTVRRPAPRRRAAPPEQLAMSGGTVALEGPAIPLAVEAGSDTPAPARQVVGYWIAVLTGLALLLLALVPVGPERLGGVGSVLVATAYAAGLAARTGGRPAFFGTLALLLGGLVLVVDDDRLDTGAAVMTCVVASVLGVMSTVPAVTYLQAVRECGVAVSIAAVGAFATLGFEPVTDVERFGYATLALALAATFAVVHRLGAGLHGLGRRGVAIVVAGGLVLVATLLYAELLRRYGTHGLVSSSLDAVGWVRGHLGAFPRPVMTVLGVPALAWGTHMRARRRQGWWVCAFGAAATVSVANSLLDPAITLREGLLSVVFGLVVGSLIGYVVIRADLLLSGAPRPRAGPAGPRGRRAEEALAVRPEPRRSRPLL